MLKNELMQYADASHAVILQHFFKTGSGNYGEGDIFLGIRVPQIRKIAKKYYNDISLDHCLILLCSSIHEERFAALVLMVNIFDKGNACVRNQVFDHYCTHFQWINNWDLVDTSAPKIIGVYLEDKPKDQLYSWAMSAHLWTRRISIIATHAFIRKYCFEDTLAISELLLNDTHDLIHKAVGWMLREVGKRDQIVLENFLKTRYLSMPRIMLRYSIERFSKKNRFHYLKGLV